MGQRAFLACGAAATALACAAGPALAALTAEDVWNNWRAAAAAMGEVITTGAQTRTGDALVLEDVRVTLPDPMVQITGTLDTITLRERGDGSVEIVFPDSYPFTIAAGPEAPDDFEIGLLFSFQGIETIASGDPDAVRYNFTADSYGAEITSFRSPDPAVTLSGSVTLGDVAGEYLVSGTSAQSFDMTMSAARIDADVRALSPEVDGRLAFVAAFEGFDFAAAGAGLPGYDTLDTLTALPDDFAFDIAYGVASGSVELDFSERANTLALAATSADNRLAVTFDRQGLSYSASSGPTAVTMSGSDVPLPEISVATEAAALALDLPLEQSPEPQDFGAELRLEGLSVDENVWGIFDPAGVLPRDPASFVVALAGKANWLIDVFDPMSAGNSMPGEVHALDLTEFLVSALGASVTGSGAFTFDNSDLATFDGMPRPTGSATFEITGANALIDRLVQLGFLPDDQASGARMMLGLFARPGGGEDVLTSTVEVRDDGSVWANGQRLQ